MIKKEYVYISIIIIASGFFIWISIVNSLRVDENIDKKKDIELEVSAIIQNDCTFPADPKWKSIIKDLSTCEVATVTCGPNQYKMNNECGCGCIEIEN